MPGSGRRLCVLAFSAALLVIGACDGTSQSASGPDSTMSGNENDRLNTVHWDEAPYESGVVPGKRYDYELLTHCGIRFAKLDGRWWETEALGDGEGNPPRGWDNYFQHGEVVMDAPDRARFLRPDGVQLDFTPTHIVPPGCA